MLIRFIFPSVLISIVFTTAALIFIIKSFRFHFILPKYLCVFFPLGQRFKLNSLTKRIISTRMHHKIRQKFPYIQNAMCACSRRTYTLAHTINMHTSHRSQSVLSFQFHFHFHFHHVCCERVEYICTYVACRVCTWLHVALALRFAQYPQLHHLNSLARSLTLTCSFSTSTVQLLIPPHTPKNTRSNISAYRMVSNREIHTLAFNHNIPNILWPVQNKVDTFLALLFPLVNSLLVV